MQTILLAEDDITFAESLVFYLEDEGFEVIWKKDGQEAFDALSEHKYSMYLFDINMPYIDGFDLLSRVRDTGDSTPCIFITAKVDTESLVHGLKLGANDYIKKPFDPDELIARMENLMGDTNKIINYGDITYDTETKLAKNSKSVINIPKREIDIFDYLIQHTDEAIKEEFLCTLLPAGSSASSIVPVISSLRSKGLKIKKLRAQNCYICISNDTTAAARRM